MDTNYRKDELLHLSEKMGISITQLKADLGISDAPGTLAKAKQIYMQNLANQQPSELSFKNWDDTALTLIDACIDFEEALTLYNTNYLPSNGKSWEAIKEKYCALGYPMLDGMQTIKEVRELWGKLSCPNYEGEKCIEKWNLFTLRDLKIAGESIPEIQKVWCESYSPSEARKAVETKLDSLVMPLVANAKNFDQAWYAYESALIISETKTSAFKVVLTFVHNFSKAVETFNSVRLNGSAEKNLALQKCLELGSFQSLIRFYRNSVIGTESGYYERETRVHIEKLALEISDKSEDVFEVRNTYNAFSGFYSPETGKILLDKWENLSATKVTTLNTVPELKEFLTILPKGSPSRIIVVKKMADLLQVA